MYDEIFISGGGFRIVPFLGVLVDLDLTRPTSFTGISAGALLAYLLALGFSVSEVLDILLCEKWARAFRTACSFERLLHGDPLVTPSPVFALVRETLRARGLSPDTTLEGLRRATGKRLRVVVANLERPGLEVLTPESHPGVRVSQALLASTAIPLIFSAVPLSGGVFFDAGVLQNNPVHLRCGPRTLALLQPVERFSHQPSWSPLQTQVRLCVSLATGFLASASVCAADGECDLAFVPKPKGACALRVARRDALRGVALGLLSWRLRPHLPTLLLGMTLAVLQCPLMSSGVSSPGTPRQAGPSPA